jgi:hypothetical protein
MASTATTSLSTSNARFTNYDFSKMFLGSNRHETAVFENGDSYDDVTIAVGSVMGRIAATGKVVLLDKDASDGSQFPVGINTEEVTIGAGDEANLSLCVAGEVDETGLVFVTGTTLATVISGKTVADRIASDTVGIHLVASTDLTAFDNS